MKIGFSVLKNRFVPYMTKIRPLDQNFVFKIFSERTILGHIFEEWILFPRSV